jgi:uncharacterized membrane protein YbhN (UPF0104 family)
MTHATASTSPRRRWMTWLRVVVSLGLLSYLLFSVDWRECVDVLRRADLRWLAVMLALLAFGRFLNGLRWYLLLRGVEPSVRYGEVMRIFFLSSFLGQFMPGVVGMEAIRVVALGRSIRNNALAFASILVDRILGFFSLVLVVLLALWLDPLPDVNLPAAVNYAALIGLVALVLGSIVLITPALRGPFELLMPGPIRRIISPRLHKVYACLDAYRGIPLRVLFVLLLSVLVQFQAIFESYAMARALHLHVDVAYFILFVPVISFLLMLPISIGGLGLREGAYIYMFHTLTQQMTYSEAFTLSLIMMFVVRLASLPGFYFVAVSRKRVSQTLHEAEELQQQHTAAPSATR